MFSEFINHFIQDTNIVWNVEYDQKVTSIYKKLYDSFDSFFLSFFVFVCLFQIIPLQLNSFDWSIDAEGIDV